MLQLSEFTKLKPNPSFKIWGGRRLSHLRQVALTGTDPLGETWEVSIHPDGTCTTFHGHKLSDYLNSEQLPYLVKFIDTSDNLSIQVHPADEYARIHENQSGKTECWLILDAAPGAGLYLGLKKGVTRDQFQKAIEASAQVDELMNFYPLKKGQFFFVPAGSLHAIGKDVLMCEVQQSSGVTYRVWDWNRLDDKGQSRELHVKKAMDVAQFEASKNELSYFRYQENLFQMKGQLKLVDHADFEMSLWNADSKESLSLVAKKRALSVICLEGEFQIGNVILKAYESGISLKNEEILSLKAGRCLIVQ
ncbi:MAG: hypothetical protein COW00_17030 [Bdellovibrio sp. CG12_big_fil_rev_8_21_14_0_65_39_13]|nr:MAG: hypothetical protein COW78_00200 [Bdellovibrio sp. CG22_combo_CG10-13_8_21_14_all_39_27]PIQ58139.1 MAG: hypothetical protein COW00_17030 [Bdellovibrio sp. CG12_big_fil_rev_8_21_14_0_65_39_13]PIR34301.1 MAG: hypothetical protein COV37_13270 [Bdellovibrio sp. CG11_big_fil_rev_8_21_14_0_20_39_38]PJB53208.1 MAG: hypothetical protein CO099_08365 [Bdellovibrio sp. CG_4_9_14_3_um_filter_39_7]